MSLILGWQCCCYFASLDSNFSTWCLQGSHVTNDMVTFDNLSQEVWYLDDSLAFNMFFLRPIKSAYMAYDVYCFWHILTIFYKVFVNLWSLLSLLSHYGLELV